MVTIWSSTVTWWSLCGHLYSHKTVTMWSSTVTWWALYCYYYNLKIHLTLTPSTHFTLHNYHSVHLYTIQTCKCESRLLITNSHNEQVGLHISLSILNQVNYSTSLAIHCCYLLQDQPHESTTVSTPDHSITSNIWAMMRWPGQICHFLLLFFLGSQGTPSKIFRLACRILNWK